MSSHFAWHYVQLLLFGKVLQTTKASLLGVHLQGLWGMRLAGSHIFLIWDYLIRNKAPSYFLLGRVLIKNKGTLFFIRTGTNKK